MGENFTKEFFDHKYGEDNSIMDIKRKFSEAKKMVNDKKNLSYSPEKNVSFVLPNSASNEYVAESNKSTRNNHNDFNNNNKSYEEQLRKELREAKSSIPKPIQYPVSNNPAVGRNEISEMLILKQQIRSQNNSLQELRSMVSTLLQDRQEQKYLTGRLENQIKSMSMQIQRLEWDLSESRSFQSNSERFSSLGTENNKYSRLPSKNGDYQTLSNKSIFLDSPESLYDRRYTSNDHRTTSHDLDHHNGYYPSPSDSTTQIIRMTEPNI